MKSWSIFYLIMIWVFNQIIYTISQYHSSIDIRGSDPSMLLNHFVILNFYSCVCVHVLWTSRWMKNWNGSLFPILLLTFYILLYLDFTTNYGYLILEPKVLSEFQIRPIIFIFCELQILHHRYWSISYHKKYLSLYWIFWSFGIKHVSTYI